jgi:hypothetical protein
VAKVEKLSNEAREALQRITSIVGQRKRFEHVPLPWEWAQTITLQESFFTAAVEPFTWMFNYHFREGIIHRPLTILTYNLSIIEIIRSVAYPMITQGWIVWGSKDDRSLVDLPEVLKTPIMVPHGLAEQYVLAKIKENPKGCIARLGSLNSSLVDLIRKIA